MFHNFIRSLICELKRTWRNSSIHQFLSFSLNPPPPQYFRWVFASYNGKQLLHIHLHYHPSLLFPGLKEHLGLGQSLSKRGLASKSLAAPSHFAGATQALDHTQSSTLIFKGKNMSALGWERLPQVDWVIPVYHQTIRLCRDSISISCFSSKQQST